MTRPENPVEGEVELKKLPNTNGELGPKYSLLGQETYSYSSCSRMNESDADEQNLENRLPEMDNVEKGQKCTLRDTKDQEKKSVKIIGIIAILLASGFIISVTFNIMQHGKLQQLQTPSALPYMNCLPNWIQNDEICYFFSDTQRTWNYSQSYCSLYGGSLLTLGSQEEQAFVMKHRRPAEYWINLQRENIDEPWKWPNGSLVDNRFYIGGKGYCAYLNQQAASSTYCENVRYWICSTLPLRLQS